MIIYMGFLSWMIIKYGIPIDYWWWLMIYTSLYIYMGLIDDYSNDLGLVLWEYVCLINECYRNGRWSERIMPKSYVKFVIFRNSPITYKNNYIYMHSMW